MSRDRPIHGRSEALQWVNGLLDADYIRIEQLGDGVAYAEIFALLHPKSVPLNKLNYNARTPEECAKNLALLDAACRRLDLRPIPVQALAKGQFQANLEFLTWCRSYYEKYHGINSGVAAVGAWERRRTAAATGPQASLSSHLLPNKPEAIALLPKQKNSPPFPTRAHPHAPRPPPPSAGGPPEAPRSDLESLRSYSSAVASSPGRPASAAGPEPPAPRSLRSSGGGDGPSSSSSLGGGEGGPWPEAAEAAAGPAGGGLRASMAAAEFTELEGLVTVLQGEMRLRLQAHAQTRGLLGALAGECRAYLDRLCAIEALCRRHPGSPLAARLLELVLQSSAPYEELPD